MSDYKQIFRLILEVEGALRVVETRESADAKELLADKFALLYDSINGILVPELKEDTESNASVSESVTDENLPVVQESTTNEEYIINDRAGESDVAEFNIDDHEVIEQQINQKDVLNTPPGQTPTPIMGVIEEDEEETTIEATCPVLEKPMTAPASKPRLYDVENSDIKVDEMISRAEARDLSNAFSINDRFRFLRELFSNDITNFNMCLQRLSELSSLSDAYDYLLNDLGWDSEKESVNDFIAIIAKHFNDSTN